MARTLKSKIPTRGFANKTIKKGIINNTDGMQSPMPIHNDVQDIFLINSASFVKNNVDVIISNILFFAFVRGAEGRIKVWALQAQ